MIKRLTSLAAILLFSACSLGERPVEPQRFLLKAPAVERHTGAKTSIKVLVPEMAAGLEGKRIAVVEQPSRLNYYTGYEWAENLPDMLQGVLVDSFQQAGIPASSDAEGVSTSYLLLLDVKEFNSQTAAQGSTIRIRMVAKLVEPASRRVITEVTLVKEVAVPQKTIQAVVDSFNQAAGDSIKELITRLRPQLRSKDSTVSR